MLKDVRRLLELDFEARAVILKPRNILNQMPRLRLFS